MARPKYGPGEHCSFDEYPDKVAVTINNLMAEETELFTSGQMVILKKTPKHLKLQGSLVLDEELPEQRAVYTDTGDDDDFSLKVTYYGWGEFSIKGEPGEEKVLLTVTKGITIQSGDWEEEKPFEIYETGETPIDPGASFLQERGILSYRDKILQTESDFYSETLPKALEIDIPTQKTTVTMKSTSTSGVQTSSPPKNYGTLPMPVTGSGELYNNVLYVTHQNQQVIYDEEGWEVSY